MILLYHILQCVYWDAAAVYLWFANHGCVFVWYPKPKDLWGLMYMQINRDSSNCSAVLCVFSNPCVPSSNRKSPLQRHSMISKWICISEMCIYVYLCKFIYLYMRINRWLCVRVFGLNQNENEIKQFYELLSMEMMCFSSLLGGFSSFGGSVWLHWIICLHVTITIASTSVTPTLYMSSFIREASLRSSSFPSAGQLHIQHPSSNMSSIAHVRTISSL